MSEPTLIQTKTSLPIGEIVLGDRLRPVSDAGVASIVASIREIGQLANPIIVRQRRKADTLVFNLLDGAHRLSAAIELGWTEIPVRVFECNDEQARLLEIDGNLAGAELNALDTAVFLATRKEVYERLHPETKHGGARGNQHTGGWQKDMMSFCQTTAEKFGLSERHVRRMTAAGSRLGPDEIRQLRLAERQVTLADLQAISKIGEPVERYEIVKLLATGEAKSAAAARKSYLHKDSPPTPIDPVDAEYLILRNKWDRARKAARRRFVDDCYTDLAELLADIEVSKSADRETT